MSCCAASCEVYSAPSDASAVTWPCCSSSRAVSVSTSSAIERTAPGAESSESVTRTAARRSFIASMSSTVCAAALSTSDVE